MKKILEKPYLIFWTFSPILFLIGYFSNKGTFDINVHDTYFVIEHSVIPITISLVFGIIGLGYWLILKFRGKLLRWMSLTHIVLTIGGIILIRLILQLYREPKAESILADYDYNESLNMINLIIALLVIFGQIIFPVNLIIGLLKRNNKTSG